jgi:hypothetical protein
MDVKMVLTGAVVAFEGDDNKGKMQRNHYGNRSSHRRTMTQGATTGASLSSSKRRKFN